MQLWTELHLKTLIPTFIFEIIISIILGYLLKNKNYEIKMIPIKIISIILLLLECVKQIYSFNNGYDLYHIPLHFCSLFLYFLPLMAFYRGKYKDFINSFTVICCAMLYVFMIIYPNMVYGEGSILNFNKGFLAFHTVIFHNLVCFAFTLMITLSLYKVDTKKDTKYIFWGYLIYSVIAAIFAQILKTNYNGFYKCNVEFIDNIRLGLIQNIGWLGQLVFVSVAILIIILFGYACYWLFRLFLLIKEKLAFLKSEN